MLGRHTEPWAGSESGGEAYGAMGRVRERWGGIRGHDQGQAVVGRHTGLWAWSGSGGEACGDMGMQRETSGGILFITYIWTCRTIVL